MNLNNYNFNNYNLDFNNDILEFINKNKKVNINYKNIYIDFLNNIYKLLIKINNKLTDINNKHEIINSAINMIYHIYFILIVYSKNINLTILLLERGMLLYTEFIIMSQDKSIIENICFVPNINDAILFVYKKTLYNLELNDIKYNKKYLFIKNISNINKNILKLLYNHFKDDSFAYIYEINMLLNNIIYNTYNVTTNNLHDYITNYIYFIINDYNIEIISKILNIKIILELMCIFIKKKNTKIPIIDTDIEDLFIDFFNNLKNQLINNIKSNINNIKNYKNELLFINNIDKIK
jgi:hypothetical protein